MPITIAEIAKIAGVSSATVSMALNNKKGVGRDTKSKIMRIADQYGYTSKKRTLANTIHFVVHQRHAKVVENQPYTQYFMELLEGVETRIRKFGYTMTISHMTTREDQASDWSTIKNMMCDGIIVLATEMQPKEAKMFLGLGVPIVVLDSYLFGEAVDTVSISNREGAFSAVEYLYEMGHREIGYFKSSDWISDFEEREQGYSYAINKLGLKYNNEHIVEIPPTLTESFEAIRLHLSSVDRECLPTSFFCDSDVIAISAMKALEECGLKVPEDISIVGFDNILNANTTSPKLTTVNVFKKEMGYKAVDRIMQKIHESDELSIKIQVHTSLVKRESVARIGGDE